MSWNNLPLGDLCSFENGDRGKNYPGRKAFVDSGIPFINAGHLNMGHIDIESMDFIPKQKYDILNSGKVRNGDILFCLRGSLGKYGIVKDLERGAIASSLIIVRGGNDLHHEFLAKYFGSELCKREIIKHTTGAAQPNLSANSLKLFEIPLPPLETQKRIVELLDRAQALIDKRKEQIDLMDRLIQSLFHDMFGDPDLDNSIATIELGFVSEKITDGTHQSPTWSKEGHPFLFVSNIKDRKIDFNTTKFISHDEYEKLTKSTPIEQGDILYTVVGSYGNPALVRTNKKFAFQRHIGHIKPNAALVNSMYLEYALDSIFVKRQVEARVTGVAQKTLILKELKKLKIILPPIDLQNAFAERIQKIEAQKEAMTTSLHELEDNFNSLMQRAFKGEI